MFPLLLSILKSLELYLAIKVKRANWELERDIGSYCDEIEDQIEIARESGTSRGDRLADKLHDRLLRSSGIAVSERRDPSP